MDLSPEALVKAKNDEFIKRYTELCQEFGLTITVKTVSYVAPLSTEEAEATEAEPTLETDKE